MAETVDALDLGSSPFTGWGFKSPLSHFKPEVYLQVDIVEKEGLKRELTIEVPADVVDEAYNKIYEDYRKKAKIKGFRPGKVPLNVIRNKYKNEVTADLIDTLINEYFIQAIREKQLEPIGKPVISKVDVDEGKPLTFTVGIEVMPTIDTVVYDNLTVEEPEIQVPDKMVDNVVERLRENNADLRSVERTAKEDDVVICDLEVIEGDLDTGEGPLSNQEIDLGHEYTVKEFRDGLAGVSRDETRNISIAYPEDYPDEKFAGKSITYKVLAKEIKERILPAVDDAFAKQAGGGETVLELRMNIRKRIEQDMRTDIKKGNKKQLMDQLVEKNPIGAPDSMVESYLNSLVKEAQENKKDVDEKEIRGKYRDLAQHAVKWYLLYHRLAIQEKIEVASTDIENWTQQFADNYHMDIARAKELLAKSGRSDEIKDGILEEKVVDFLMSKADVKTGRPITKEGKA